jgi:hypothetical protein
LIEAMGANFQCETADLIEDNLFELSSGEFSALTDIPVTIWALWADLRFFTGVKCSRLEWVDDYGSQSSVGLELGLVRCSSSL